MSRVCEEWVEYTMGDGELSEKMCGKTAGHLSGMCKRHEIKVLRQLVAEKYDVDWENRRLVPHTVTIVSQSPVDPPIWAIPTLVRWPGEAVRFA